MDAQDLRDFMFEEEVEVNEEVGKFALVCRLFEIMLHFKTKIKHL